MMDYHTLVKKLFAINKTGGVKFGLDNSLQLSQALGSPEKKYPTIHVAGTNGKGSVVTKIAKALEFSGKTVGLYTSPHISCFRERIRINGELIPEDEVVKILTLLFQISEAKNIPATFFELTTLLAFEYFANQKVDYAVLETGLGGRLDSTNICQPDLSIITSISLEHTDVLGNTIEEIAREKAGIIKSGIPIIIGPRVPYPTIAAIAKPLNSLITQISGTFSDFNDENNAIAQKALELLEIPKQYIDLGLKCLPPCRIETLDFSQFNLKHQPNAIVLDVAHNPDGLIHLFKVLNKRYPHQKLRIICGLSRNKDIPACVEILSKHGTDFHLVESTNGRGESPQVLFDLLKQSGISQKHLFLTPTIEKTVNLALKEAANDNQILVICGTFFIMSTARCVLGIVEPRDPIDLNEQSTGGNLKYEI